MSSNYNPIASQLAKKLSDPALFAPPSFGTVTPSQPYITAPNPVSFAPLPNSINAIQLSLKGRNYQTPQTLINLPSVSGNADSFGLIGGPTSGMSLPTAKFPSNLNQGSLSHLDSAPLVAAVLKQPQIIPPITERSRSKITFADTADLAVPPANPHMIQSLVTRPVILNTQTGGFVLPNTPVLNTTFQPTNSLVQYNTTDAAISNQLATQIINNSIRSRNLVSGGSRQNDLYGSIAGMDLLDSIKNMPSVQHIPEVYHPSGIQHAVSMISSLPSINVIPPRFQAAAGAPGVVTAVGPTQVIGKVETGCERYCPWWISYLLCLCSFVMLMGACYYYFAIKKVEDQQRFRYTRRYKHPTLLKIKSRSKRRRGKISQLHYSTYNLRALAHQLSQDML